MDNDAARQAEFVGLIARHQAGLHAFIISLMPGTDGVDDVLQETNIILWEKRKSFETGTNFMAWACKIARYKVMNHRSRMAKFNHVCIDPGLAESLTESIDFRPEHMDTRMEALRHCLGRLPDEQREMIERRYIKETSLTEHASHVGRSPDSLKVTLFRIRAALKKCISGELNLERARS